MPLRIPFNRPFTVGTELAYIHEAIAAGHLSGDGTFTARCSKRLEEMHGVARALLTHSCTSALELAALLANVGPGDEVIMPSYTFVSTANAFALRGATPVFVDIRGDTLNIDENAIGEAISPRTRAIVPVHYAGVGCEMDPIMALAAKHDLLVIEDAAQGVCATYRGRALGASGHLGSLSFHETKNVLSGEGGALLLRDEAFVARAEILREKGTNRSAFFRGQVDKYTWVDLGSSFLPSEIVAAFLWAQLERAEELTARRLAIWNRYHDALADLEHAGFLRRPIVPQHCTHNAHMYYVLLHDAIQRQRVIRELAAVGIGAVFHYVPLHDAPAGRKYGLASSLLPVTTSLSERLLRLPIWVGIEPHLDEVIEQVRASVTRGHPSLA
jgi:dTDP-4-amino-4,6-dideoxygalactose transaminase